MASLNKNYRQLHKNYRQFCYCCEKIDDYKKEIDDN